MPLRKKIPVTVLLKEKGVCVYWVSDDSTVDAAVAEMNRHRIGSVLVKCSGKVVGIFTERDVLTRVIADGRDPKATRVREVMTSDFQSITQGTSIEDAMQRMSDQRVRHLPVLEENESVGMISIGDITRWLLKVNQLEADNLRRYVSDEYPG